MLRAFALGCVLAVSSVSYTASSSLFGLVFWALDSLALFMQDVTGNSLGNHRC